MEYVSKTYLKDINKYELSFFINLEYAISVKKVIEISTPFIINEEGNLIKVLDNGYYILEYIPFNKEYICRIHLNEKKEIIERFYIATKNNKMLDGIPTFDSLKISYVCHKNSFKVYNADIIKNMLNSNLITKNEYDKAFSVINEIKNEIDKKINFIYNFDYNYYL